MFSHVMLGADDIEASKTFYDACFKALGGREGSVDPKGRVIYMHNGGIFLITKPIDGGTTEFFAQAADVIVTIEDHVIKGGYGSIVRDHLGDCGITTPVVRIGWPDQFIEHASSVG